MVHGNAYYESSKHSRPALLPKVCTSITPVKHMQLCLSMQAHAKHWQSDSRARGDHRRPHGPTRSLCTALQADKSCDNDPSSFGSIERSMPVGMMLLPAARASGKQSVQWLRCMSRDVRGHTCRWSRRRRHVDRRPACIAHSAGGHARAIGAGLQRLQGHWHTIAAAGWPSA